MLNLTPDSFSDGGAHDSSGAALVFARRLVADGADVVDVGGESTRPAGATYGPGYVTLSAEDEIARIADVVRALGGEGIPFSIDTTKPAVARFALEHGASVVNDTSAGADSELLRVVAEHGAAYVLMHNRGRGNVSGDNVRYGDVVQDVVDELARATDGALAEGVPESAIAWDPGLGFAKTAEQSLRLLTELPRIVEIGYPVFVGASRKSFLAKTVALPGEAAPGPLDRLAAGLVAHVACVERGAAIVRTHDVAATKQALAMAHALRVAREDARAPARAPVEVARA